MPKLPISVIILNASSEISDELRKSVAWADEVMVVTFLEKIENFAQARNEAAEKAKNEIIFFIDSDEVVSDNISEKIRTLIDRSDWFGATILRRDIFLGKEMKYGEVGNVKIVRLFRKGTFHFERPVHEVAVVNGKIIDSDITLFHHGHDSIASFIGKVLLYMQLEFEHRQKVHEHVSFLSLIAWPAGKFLSNYILKLGSLDGWQGLIYATVMSLHSFGLRAQLFEVQHEK